MNIFKLYSAFIILYILTSSLFSRTVQALYIQFRLGEIAVGIGILSTLLILIYDDKNTFVKRAKLLFPYCWFRLFLSTFIINLIF